MVACKKREVKNCLGIKEGDISGDYMDDFVRK